MTSGIRTLHTLNAKKGVLTTVVEKNDLQTVKHLSNCSNLSTLEMNVWCFQGKLIYVIATDHLN